MGFVIEL